MVRWIRRMLVKKIALVKEPANLYHFLMLKSKGGETPMDQELRDLITETLGEDTLAKESFEKALSPAVQNDIRMALLSLRPYVEDIPAEVKDAIASLVNALPKEESVAKDTDENPDDAKSLFADIKAFLSGKKDEVKDAIESMNKSFEEISTLVKDITERVEKLEKAEPPKDAEVAKAVDELRKAFDAHETRLSEIAKTSETLRASVDELKTSLEANSTAIAKMASETGSPQSKGGEETSPSEGDIWEGTIPDAILIS